MTCNALLYKASAGLAVSLARHLRRLLLTGAVWACAVVVFVTSASATALGPWQQISTSAGPNIDEVGLVRTADGNLHVAWLQPGSGGTENLWHMSIPPSGGVGGGAATIVQGWKSLSNPALAIGPGGTLEAFVGGIRSLDPGDPFGDMNLLTSTDGGTSWTLQNNGDVVAPGASAYSSPVAVAIAGATPFETWYGTSGVWVHAGISSATANTNYQSFGCCGYYSNLAVDGTGATELAWYSNASGHLGVYTQALAADGSPAGSPAVMPGTATDSIELQRTPIVGRAQGGFYVAYPTGYPSFTAVKLWKVGSGSATTVAKLNHSGGTPAAGLSVDPAGRIWVFWTNYVNDKPQVFATRSNPAVTRFGAIVPVGAPAGAGSAYSIDGNAGSGALDLFSAIAVGQSTSTWYRHVYPGLSLAVSPASIRARRAHKVTLTVTDAGVPVKGAAVKLAGHTGKTNGAGKLVLHVKAAGSLTATASRAGYVSGTAKLRVTK